MLCAGVVKPSDYSDLCIQPQYLCTIFCSFSLVRIKKLANILSPSMGKQVSCFLVTFPSFSDYSFLPCIVVSAMASRSREMVGKME